MLYSADICFFATFEMTAPSEAASEAVLRAVVDGATLEAPHPKDGAIVLSGTIGLDSVEEMNDTLDPPPEDVVPEFGLHLRAMDVKAFINIDIEAATAKEAEKIATDAFDGMVLDFGTHDGIGPLTSTLAIDSIDVEKA